MTYPFPKTAAQFRKHVRSTRYGWTEEVAPKEPEDSTPAPKVVFHLGDYAHVSYEYGALIVNLSQSYFFELDRLHELDWLEHVRGKNWVSLDVIQLLRRLYAMYPKPTAPAAPARSIPLPALELMAGLAGIGCNDQGPWPAIDEAAEVFAHYARKAGGCQTCPPFDGDCPSDPLAVTQMLAGMLALLGITAKSDNGYGFEFQRLAKMLAKDVKDFGPKQPRQGTQKAAQGVKTPKLRSTPTPKS